jgi:hypothetical protein
MREVNKKRGARISGSRTRLYDAGTCVSCSSQSWLFGTTRDYQCTTSTIYTYLYSKHVLLYVMCYYGLLASLIVFHHYWKGLHITAMHSIA